MYFSLSFLPTGKIQLACETTSNSITPLHLFMTCLYVCSQQGRKKKPFIDKKKAQRFQLVPRSQRDPLCGDAEERQYVLKPTEVSERKVKVL